MDPEQLRLAADLLAVMRAAAGHALARGGRFVAPPDLLLALLDDAHVGPALTGLVAHERLAKALAGAADKPPGVVEAAEDALASDQPAPFARYGSLAFRAGADTLYLDADAHHIFIEGARRADDAYQAKHLALGFAEEAVKDRQILVLFGADPQDVSSAVAAL
jgi:hypothetical protein